MEEDLKKQLEDARKEIDVLRGVIAEGLSGSKKKVVRKKYATPEIIALARRRLLDYMKFEGELTEGVLRNRVRNIESSEVDSILEAMVEEGLLVKREYVTIKGRYVSAYSLSR